MPLPEPSSRQSSSELRMVKERGGKKLSKQEIELKRTRGEVSCAECQRLKMRCDKNIPCSSCVRRDCRALCPNGVLVSGSRYVLSDADEVHQKITGMSNRIRQLEEALANAQATSSRESHPLLRPELLEIKHSLASVASRRKRSSGSHANSADANSADELDKGILQSFCDLVLDDGREAFPTPIVDREESIQAKESVSVSLPSPELPVQIKYLSGGFPFAQAFLAKDEMQGFIEARLPTYERATSLIELYTQFASWWVRSISREQIVEELLPGVYKQRRGQHMPVRPSSSIQGTDLSESAYARTTLEKVNPHDLAALLVVFACGAAGDFTLEPNNDEAELYYQLARAALSLKPVLDSPSLTSVQAIVLMGYYDIISAQRRSLESAYKTISFAMTLGISIGLHRDPTHSKFEPKMIQRRRELFWELRHIDAWKSLGTRRPVGVHPDDVDCELPIDSDATLDENGMEVPSFWHWKRLFLRDALLPIVHVLTSAKPLKYAEILELDGKVREFGRRSLARQIVNSIGGEGYLGTDGVRSYLQKYMLSLQKDISLQLLHRNFFARALLDYPKNPVQSAFAPSFLTCYHSAISLLCVVREHFEVIPHVMVRYWPIWVHSLISAIILGSVAFRAPSCDLAPRAYVDFVLSIGTFIKARSHQAIQVTLPAILRLREKASRALAGAGRDPEKLMEELGPVQKSHEGIYQAAHKPTGLGNSVFFNPGALSETAANVSHDRIHGDIPTTAATLDDQLASSDMVNHTLTSTLSSGPGPAASSFTNLPLRTYSNRMVEETYRNYVPGSFSKSLLSNCAGTGSSGDSTGRSSLVQDMQAVNSAFCNDPSRVLSDGPWSQYDEYAPFFSPLPTHFESEADQRENMPGDTSVESSIHLSANGPREGIGSGDALSMWKDMQEPDFAALLSMSLESHSPLEQLLGESVDTETFGSNMNMNMDWADTNVADLNNEMGPGNTATSSSPDRAMQEGDTTVFNMFQAQIQEHPTVPVDGSSILHADESASSRGEQDSLGQAELDILLRRFLV